MEWEKNRSPYLSFAFASYYVCKSCPELNFVQKSASFIGFFAILDKIDF